MAIYTYHCKACDVFTEKVLKMDDYMLPTTLPCESCSAMEVEKIVDAPRLVDPTKLMGGPRIDTDFRSVLEGVSKSTYKSDFNIR